MSGLLVRLNNRVRDTAGAAIALVALTMVVLLSCVALAVDVGMLVTARTESQTVADGAALAGAGKLLENQGANPDEARDAAILAGSTDNTVRGNNVTILPEDVDVIPEDWTVRVRVHSTQERGSAIPTFFARIFGVNEVDVSTVAAAWAVKSTTIGGDEDPTCPALPLALHSKFFDTGDPGWDGEEIVGWSAVDHGNVVRLKTQPSSNNKTKQGDVEPPPVVDALDYCNEDDSSWRCWWRMPDEEPSTGPVGEKIRGENCTDPVDLDDLVYNAAGNMQVNVHQDFSWLADQDPDLQWCEYCAGTDDDGNDVGCVVEGEPPAECFTGTSLRMRSVPVIDPTSVTGTGTNVNAQVIGFMGVFVERVAANFADESDGPPGQQNVYLRLLFDGGTGTGTDPDDDDDDPGAFVRTLQLIE